MKPSIHLRLALSTLVVLTCFLGLTGLLLQRAQQSSLERAVEGQLLGQVFGLLSEAQVDAQGHISLPSRLADPRLNRTDSGLSAELAGSSGLPEWRSASLLGLAPEPLPELGAGKQRFFRDAKGYHLLYGLEWEGDDGGLQSYVIRVSLRAEEADQRREAFRLTLWAGLLLLGLLLLLAQALLLRWGLWPLRQISGALKAVEEGRAEEVQGVRVTELRPLADNLNSLLRHNRAQQERFRNSLADLAHSIKTPLALLQGALESGDDEALRQAARQAVPHIDALVQGRLKHAALAGSSAPINRTALRPLAQRLIHTLEKLYQGRNLMLENWIAEDALLAADENDLMELLGNLLDNACKFATARVRVSGQRGSDGWLHITVEDDGPGIDAGMRERVLARGGRLDEQYPGQGIGLAAVRTIVSLYQGEMRIERSQALGGAALCLQFSL